MNSKLSAYMPVYTGEFLRKTVGLRAHAKGAYLGLKMYYWDNGPIPDDDDLLFKIADCERKSVWKKLRPSLSRLFQIKDGFWVDVEADFERQKLEDHRQKLSAGGKKSQENRAKNSSENNQVAETKTPLPVSQPVDLKGNTFNQAEAELQQTTPTSVSTTSINNTTSNTTATTSYVKVDDAFEGDVTDRKFVREKAIRLAGSSPNCYPTIGEVDKWQDAGCDPILDIFPVIQANMERRKGNAPNSMTYFTQAILTAKANRLKPLPAPKENYYAKSIDGNQKSKFIPSRDRNRYAEAFNSFEASWDREQQARGVAING